MRRHDLDNLITELAAEQQGTIARWQAYELGMTRRHLERRVRSGQLRPETENVFSLAGAPDGDLRELWVARLHAGPDGVVSHRAGAWAHQAPSFGRLEAVEVRTAHGRHLEHKRFTIHQSRHAVPVPTCVPAAPGLPVSPLERCMIELAAVISGTRLDHVLHELLAADRLQVDRLHRLFLQLHGAAMPGGRRLERILGSLAPRDELGGSALEQLLRQVLAQLPGPPARYEAAFPGREAFGNRVDALIDDARLIVEADGRRWHSRKADQARDRARDRDAVAAGYATLRYGWEELSSDPHGVLQEIATIRAQRLELFTRVA